MADKNKLLDRIYHTLRGHPKGFGHAGEQERRDLDTDKSGKEGIKTSSFVIPGPTDD